MNQALKSGTLALLLCGLLAAAGCGGAKKADTPKAAVENMVNAAKAGDGAAFAACFDAEGEQKKFAEAMGDMIAAMKELDLAAEKKFGKEEWKKAKSTPDEVSVPSGVPEDIDLSKVTIKEDGDKAVATMEGESKGMNLVRKNGAWLIVMDGIPTEGPQLEAGLRMMKAMTDGMKQAQAKVATAATPEEVSKVIGETMMKAMMEEVGKSLPRQ